MFFLLPTCCCCCFFCCCFVTKTCCCSRFVIVRSTAVISPNIVVVYILCCPYGCCCLLSVVAVVHIFLLSDLYLKFKEIKKHTLFIKNPFFRQNLMINCLKGCTLYRYFLLAYLVCKVSVNIT